MAPQNVQETLVQEGKRIVAFEFCSSRMLI